MHSEREAVTGLFAGGLFDLRGADELVADTRSLPTPRKLCGGLWREGELAILFGAKGMGEASLLPTSAAIANAIYDAVGVRLKELPFTPDKVMKALNELPSK